MKWLGGLTLTCVFLAGCNAAPPVDTAAAAAAADEAPASPASARTTTVRAREVTLPAGTTLRLELRSAVASDTSSVEDTVRATLRQPVTLNGQTALPAGTELVGTVTDVERAGRVKGRARVAYRFSSVRFQGESYRIRTAPLVHEAEATKSEDATKIAAGAGAGAVVGAILGGGSGAAKGAAIGGAAGTGAVLATRGKEIRLGPGADVTTRLEGPVTIRIED
jgi:hypothetical protein